MAFGKVREPNDYYKRIVMFLKTTNGLPFGATDIVSQTGVSLECVATFLLRYTKREFLKRQGTCTRYKYTVVKIPPALRKSLGEPAQKVWNILVATKVSIAEREILSQINNTESGNDKFSPGAIHNVIQRLYARGALIRTKPGHYLLHLEWRTKERPTLSA